MNKIFFVTILSSCFYFCNLSYAKDKIKIVATLTTYADIAKTVGGNRVQVSHIAPPTFDPHHITPKPSDVMKLKRADLFIHGGLDLEVWREPLLNAVGKSRIRSGGDRNLSLSQEIKILEIPDHQINRSDGDIHLNGNPHFWISPENGKIIAKTIFSKLVAIDRSHEMIYKNNLDRFTAKIDKLIVKWKYKFKQYRGLEIIAYHNQWIYLTDFLGIKVNVFIEPKPGIHPSTKHILYLQSYIKSNKVKGIIQSSFMPKKISEKISIKSDVKVALLCQNVGENSEVITYLSMQEYNFKHLYDLLK
jgi:zinc/manganese transport system substrate-binding protein